MTALPPNKFPPGIVHEAYATCLDLQNRAMNVQQLKSGPTVLVCARFLGYVILEAPTTTGQENFAREVTSCQDGATLCKLAKFYIDHFVRCFRAAKGRTPIPSEHPSRPSFDDIQETLAYLLREPTRNHQTAKSMALIRDGYRCIVSGRYDFRSIMRFPTVRAARESSGAAIASLKAAHIIGESINAGISTIHDESTTRHYASTVWAVLDCFGGVFFEELNGADVHRLENVMTMDPIVHDFFDSLDLWLEATETPNCYRLNASDATILLDLPATITFTSTDPRLALPSPRYLGIHAACARVAHLSAAGKYVEDMFRDLEELPVLASDGTSADALNLALSRIGISVK
ncbi:hypothetical protein FRC02_005533 [Tulasnella sp. 418]|nr:hypothetical protein FRC02_005533 [Tulasnella sp. 418]